ncbi:DoxX family protein [Actinomadura hibisca]|uniref:DoxX family protein n=1 Tax=Actinomadura hibisca TaxID=68565 RepID=UPI00082E3D4A|nr:DoxX family protein [Actinomadura hibisca]
MAPIRRFPHLPDAGLLVGRIVLGVVFVAHGWQKLTDVGHAGVTQMFKGMGIPLPSVAAAFATWVELLGGVALILGLLVPLAGLLLAADMAGALWFAHIDKGLFAAEGGYELVLVLGAMALLLACTGAGRFSADAVLWGRRSRTAAPERETAGV